MNANPIHHPSIKACNQLLRVEISAVETFEQAMDKYQGYPALVTLVRMRDEHLEGIEKLRGNVLSRGGEPVTDSGASGMFARALQATAGFFGENTAIAALKDGEANRIADCQELMDRPEIEESIRNLIGKELLPMLRIHLRGLHLIAA